MGINLGITGWIAIIVVLGVVVLALTSHCTAIIGPFGIH